MRRLLSGTRDEHNEEEIQLCGPVFLTERLQDHKPEAG